MKSKIIIILALPVLLALSCARKKAIQTHENAVLESVINDVMAEEHLKNITIADKYRIWNIGVDVDFNLPGESLPKTEKERRSRLEGELIDPYRIWYVFAYPLTDTLFTKEDRDFISKQMKDTSIMTFGYTSERIKLVGPKEGEIHAYYFCKPVFDRNYRYAIIRKYDNYTITEDGTLFGSSQTLYYKNDKKKGWIRVFATPIWL